MTVQADPVLGKERRVRVGCEQHVLLDASWQPTY